MKKIMFNDKFQLTEAVLQGRKTQTRRIVKANVPLGNWEETVKYAPYKVCEIVAIAQRYKDIGSANFYTWEQNSDWFKTGFNNKMFTRAEFMPHQIRITGVRIEQLQDISDEDCLKEGIFKVWDTNVYGIVGKHLTSWINPKDVYAYLIDKISGKGTWEANPFVWVYDFELIK